MCVYVCVCMSLVNVVRVESEDWKLSDYSNCFFVYKKIVPIETALMQPEWRRDRKR